jgi:ion channel-forming bestrophin family protein
MLDHDQSGDVRETAPPAYSYWLGTFLLRGAVGPRIIADVLAFGLISAAIVYASQFVIKHYQVSLTVPAGPFEVAGAVLALMLVLRLNAGYERWWEARKLWGGVVNQSRNLAILGLAYGPTEHEWRVHFIKWVATFPHVMRRSLRGEHKLPELTDLLSEEQISWLLKNQHMPDAVSREIASLLKEARRKGMDGFEFQEAERQRGLLIDHLGGCERILKTPLARSGAIQVRQFIFIFLTTLPLPLLQDVDGTLFDAGHGLNELYRIWLIPLFVMLLAYMLLSLDRIGMELQNPFDTRRIDFLPLDSICMTIEKNLLELLHDDDLHSYLAPAVEDVVLPPDASLGITDDDLPANVS